MFAAVAVIASCAIDPQTGKVLPCHDYGNQSPIGLFILFFAFISVVVVLARLVAWLIHRKRSR